jgi:hypothetical protein
MRFFIQIAVSLALVIAATSCDSDRSGPNADNSMLKAVQEIWRDLPIYEGFKEVYLYESSRGKSVRVSRQYQSDAQPDSVKVFYLDYLKKEGWAFVKERKLSDWGRDLGGTEAEFLKGEYVLDLTYAGSMADYGWEYAIGVEWHAP